MGCGSSEQVGGHPMSVRRIQKCLMTAMVAGLLALVAADAQAFGGKFLGKKGGCDACNPCGPGGAGAGGAGTGPGQWVTQKQKVTEYVQQQVDQTVTVMQQQQKQETYTAYKWE